MADIELSIREVNLKTIKFMDMAVTDNTNKEAATKRLLTLGSDITEDEINNLNVRDGIKLTKAINELNGFTENAFQ